MQPPAAAARENPAILGVPAINTRTGLSTDYLNHFSEAMMLLEMLADSPECLPEFLTWHAKTYREHFSASGFSDAAHVIAAYEGTVPELRHSLDTLSAIMNTMLTATREAMAAHGTGPMTTTLAADAVQALRPLVSRAASLINGTAPALYGARVCDAGAIDAMFAR